jgi:Y_Y_Y domain
MYFGSVNGLIVFHPDSIHQNPIAPDVVITDLKVFNRSIVAGDESRILTNHISQTQEIFLPYESDVLTLNFVALNYTSTPGNQYAYKMEGFDKDWVQARNTRSATYTSLEPGSYTFRVRASNSDGVWNQAGVTLVIHVMPPWWKATWFRVVFLFALLLAGFTFYRVRVRAIAQKNIKLNKLVKEKTSELEVLNEAVSTQNKILKERQEEIVVQNTQLTNSRNEIAEQRDIIEKQNEEIKLRNESLELEVQNRTKELLNYNQQLEQFAFISAHNLRAPVQKPFPGCSAIAFTLL